MSIARSALPALSVAAVAVGVGLAVHSPAAAAPSTTTPSATTPSATTTSASSSFATDERGYLDSAARCDRSQSLMAYGRTTRSLVAICVSPSGDLEYRGERLSDGASLTMPAGRTADGSIIATNDGATYAVSPTMFLISQGDEVLYRDSWTEFHQPRFSPGSSAESSVPAPATSAAPAGTPTVSTTTVTLPPTTNG